MSISRHNIFLTLFLTAALMFSGGTKAQNVESIQSSKLHPMMFDIYAYASGSYMTLSNLWTASTDIMNDEDMYATYVNLGVEAEAYKYSNLRLGASLGYKYERYAYNIGFSQNEGIFTHWLTPSINVAYVMSGLSYRAGLFSDIYLGSSRKTNNDLSYEGLNSNCFNRTTLAWFFSMAYQFNRIRVEGRIGSYITPQLNPDKIAYYNLHKTYVKTMFIEAKLAWRLYTTGSHYSSSFLDF
ncbi:MAG: hypothetical protein J5486_06055 [Bacteroidaceae bacterium]|nr:hypothetical protein [Bacteroidaceae bacterium]